MSFVIPDILEVVWIRRSWTPQHHLMSQVSRYIAQTQQCKNKNTGFFRRRRMILRQRGRGRGKGRKHDGSLRRAVLCYGQQPVIKQNITHEPVHKLESEGASWWSIAQTKLIKQQNRYSSSIWTKAECFRILWLTYNEKSNFKMHSNELVSLHLFRCHVLQHQSHLLLSPPLPNIPVNHSSPRHLLRSTP